MREIGILMTAAMVIATREDRKSMTRRLSGLEKINENPDAWVPIGWVLEKSSTDKSSRGRRGDYMFGDRAMTETQFPIETEYGRPRYRVGDRLWVRETFLQERSGCTYPSGEWVDHWVVRGKVEYVADGATPRHLPNGNWMGKRPSIFMPRWASRIMLEVTAVRVERLQDISPEDAWEEGVECTSWAEWDWDDDGYRTTMTRRHEYAKEQFEELWDSINAKKHPWSSNPWVWVYEFKVVNP